MRVIPFFELILYLMMHDPSVKIGRNQNCTNADDDDNGDMIPMCRSCLAGDTTSVAF